MTPVQVFTKSFPALFLRRCKVSIFLIGKLYDPKMGVNPKMVGETPTNMGFPTKND